LLAYDDVNANIKQEENFNVEHGGIDMREDIDMREIKVNVLSEKGLGYGEGSISVQEQLDGKELSQESLTGAIEIVQTDSTVFVPVEAHDDGCGDGRATKRIYRFLDKLTGKIETFKRSVPRAKVFGGGLVVASSMWRAVSDTPSEQESLESDRHTVADLLKEHGIGFGAHTADSHTSETTCGCGAIDKYREITANVSKYRTNIEGTLRVLYGDTYEDNQEAISYVFDLYSSLDENYFQEENGKKTMDFIETQGAVVKELTEDHLEDMVVLNDIEGTTLDQDKLRAKLREKGLSPDIQAFVVDVWRGRMYASLVAEKAQDTLKMDKAWAYKVAYADFLMRTCATSATLTTGDQPVIYRGYALAA
jgi:hypothetical protein